MGKEKPSIVVKEAVDVLRLMSGEKVAMAPNEEIWEFLVEQFLSRMDVYQPVSNEEGYKLVHPLKHRTDYMTIYTVDLRAALTTTKKGIMTLIALTYQPTWAGVVQTVNGASNELRIFPREIVDQSRWELFKSRM